jgi:hypothetical protein
VRLSEGSHRFELAEGEELDLGVISMAGATVRVRTRLVDQQGRSVPVEEAILEAEAITEIVVGNAIQGEKTYYTQFLVRLGDSSTYEIHGLSAPTSLSLGGGKVNIDGFPLPWTLRPGFREDILQTSSKRFDPYQEPEVTLDYHLLRVSTCPVSFFLPPGKALQVRTGLSGVAIPAGGGKPLNIQVKSSGPDNFRGELGLPEGRYDYILTMEMPPASHQPGYFVRGSLELPCASSHDAVLTPGLTVRGTVTDGAGKPLAQRLVRVGFQGDPLLTGAWMIATDREGRFVLAGLPPGSTLLPEGAREPIALGAADVEDAHVVISP